MPLRCARGHAFAQPGGLEPRAPGGGKFGLGVIERDREAIEANRPVRDPVEEPHPFVAAGMLVGAVDCADADFAAVDLEVIVTVADFVSPEHPGAAVYRLSPEAEGPSRCVALNAPPSTSGLRP
jgi:hypothetical protein